MRDFSLLAYLRKRSIDPSVHTLEVELHLTKIGLAHSLKALKTTSTRRESITRLEYLLHPSHQGLYVTRGRGMEDRLYYYELLGALLNIIDAPERRQVLEYDFNINIKLTILQIHARRYRLSQSKQDASEFMRAYHSFDLPYEILEIFRDQYFQAGLTLIDPYDAADLEVARELLAGLSLTLDTAIPVIARLIYTLATQGNTPWETYLDTIIHDDKLPAAIVLSLTLDALDDEADLDINIIRRGHTRVEINLTPLIDKIRDYALQEEYEYISSENERSEERDTHSRSAKRQRI